MAVIHCRIFAYTLIIITHVSNMLFMMSRFHGDVMKNPHVRHFSEMQCFFFTCWTFTMQTVYSAIALYSDVLVLKNGMSGDSELPKILVHLREEYFTILAWPSTMLTSSLFWMLFAYDRGLVYPADIDLAIPTISNHIMHTGIAVASFWEALLRPRTAPGNHAWRFLAVLFVEIIYIIVIVGVYLIKGVWVYPIFGLLIGSVYFYLFFLAIAAWLLVIYHAQWTLNHLVWGPSGKEPWVNAVMCYAKRALHALGWSPRNCVKKAE